MTPEQEKQFIQQLQQAQQQPQIGIPQQSSPGLEQLQALLKSKATSEPGWLEQLYNGISGGEKATAATKAPNIASSTGNVAGEASLLDQAMSWLGGSSGSGAVAQQSVASSAVPTSTAEMLASDASANIIGQTATGEPILGVTQPTGLSSLSTLGPYAAAALAAIYTGDRALKTNKDAKFSAKNPITGFKVGMENTGVGSLIDKKLTNIPEGVKTALNYSMLPVTGIANPVIGAISAFTGSGKDKDQHARDSIRKNIQSAYGLEKNDYILNGFDFGKDGGFKMENGLHPYDVDFNEAGSGQKVADLNALGAIFSGGGKKQNRDTTGLLYNSFKGGDSKEAYSKAGLNHDSAYGTVHQMYVDGKLDKATADAYKNGLDELYQVGAYKGGAKPKAATPAVATPAPTPAASAYPAGTKTQQTKPKTKLTSQFIQSRAI